MITVYTPEVKNPVRNGLKVLKPRRAVIRKEDNGDYYVDLRDTADNLKYYAAGNIVRVSTPWGKQMFRLEDPKVQVNRVDVRGRHVFFDTANYLIDDSYVVDKSANDALDHINRATDIESPFTTISDVDVVASLRVVRQSLQEAVSRLVERWGGHIVMDNYNIAVKDTIGEDRGVQIKYGKNLVDFGQDEDWSLVATKILPVGKDGLEIPDTYIENGVDDYPIPYSKVVKFDQDIDEDDFKDVNGEFDEAAYNAALLSDLQSQAIQYLEDNHLPKVNYSVKAYLKGISDLGDVITVKHPKINVELTTRVLAMEYDAIADRITKVEFGNFKRKLSGIVDKAVEQSTQKAAEMITDTKAKLEGDLIYATDLIKGTMQNSHVIYDGDKILVVDKLPKETATNVIMINNGGIGFSNSGINGVFSSAWTIDNQLNMENINVINLVADMIKGGTLKLGQDMNQRGIIEIYGTDDSLAGVIDNTGLTMYTKTGESVKVNPIDGFAGYDANGQKIYWADGLEFHQRKSVVEEEITIGHRLRIIPITTDTNKGVGFVTLVGND